MFHTPVQTAKQTTAEQGCSGTTGARPQVGTPTAELVSQRSPEGTSTAQGVTPTPLARKSIDTVKGTTAAASNTTFTVAMSPGPVASAKEATKLYQQGLIQLDKSGNISRQIKTSVKAIMKNLLDIVVKLEKDNKELEKKKGKTKRRSLEPDRLDEEEEKITNRHLLEQLEAVKELVKGNTAQVNVEELGKGQKQIMKEVQTNGVKLAELKEQVKTDREQTEEVHEEIIRVVTEVGSTAEAHIRGTFHALSEEHKEGRPTYAQAASGLVRQSMHSLLISSKDPGDSGDDIIKKVRTAVDAKTTGIRVDRIRRARDAKIVLGCEDDDQINLVKERLERAGEGLLVEEKRNKDPLVILKDIMADTTDANIIQALQTQNPQLNAEAYAEKMQVRYRKKTRNPLLVHVVMSVPTAVWTTLTMDGYVHVDLQRVRVLDQSPLVQCSRCLKFGHGKRLCTETADLCSHCGEPHMRSECPAYKEYSPPSCRNCVLAKYEKVDHNAFHEECPVRKRWDALARSRVSYDYDRTTNRF